MNCLVYRINDSLYAVDAGTVVGVEDSLKLSTVPGMPDFILGLSEIRGRMTPVVSVHRFFGLPVKDGGTALVIGDDKDRIAFLTDGIEAIREIDFNNNNEAPLIIRNFAGCVKNMTLLDDRPVIFMDLMTIIPEGQKVALTVFMEQIEARNGDEKGENAGETQDGSEEKQ